jgi:hypothetical protein
MTAKFGLLAGVAVALAAGLPAGCKSKAAQMSSLKTVLANQHAVWDNLERTMKSDRPNLDLLASADMMFYETPGKIEAEYGGSNKAQVLAKLASIRKQFQDTVLPKVVFGPRGTVLAEGESLAELRPAVDKLLKEYREFKAMVK